MTIRLTGKCAAQKIKNFCSSSLWTCLHHMVILKSQNRITNFLWFKPDCVALSYYYVRGNSVGADTGHVQARGKGEVRVQFLLQM